MSSSYNPEGMKPHAGFAEPDSDLTRHRSSTTHHTCDMNSTPDDHDIFCAEYDGDGIGCDDDSDDDNGGSGDDEDVHFANLELYHLLISDSDEGDVCLPFDPTMDYSAA